MFTAALLTIAKIRKQPKCLYLINEWTTKMYIYTHIYTMEYHSAMRREFATTWMDLKHIMLSDTRQSKTRTV